mgnify:CR=1 FL=1
MYRVLQAIPLILLGIAVGIALQSIFTNDRPWDRDAMGGEELPLLRQTLGPSCGPTSLAMVAQAWGIPLREWEAVLLTQMKPQGTSLSDLARAGSRIGLELVGMRLDWGDLIKANKPIIAHMPPSHYVVIEEATRKQVTIIDPISGRQEIPSAQFAQMWAGNCLVVRGKKSPSVIVGEMPSPFVTEWQFAGPYAYDKGTPNHKTLADADNLHWRSKKPHASSQAEVFINLSEQFGKQEWTTAYAQTWVYSPMERSVVFRIGSDDGIEVELNGQRILEKLDIARSCRLDEDIIPAVLHRGWNHLFLQIVQIQGDWQFVVRITDEQGNSLPDLKIQSENPAS